MSAAEKQVTVPEAIEAAKERFLQIAPKGLDFTAEHGFAVQLLNNNDYLKQAALGNPLSLQAAIINVAAIGLSLNPAKKQAYLIPRNMKQKVNGKDQWVTKIFLEPSYMGLVDLATMSGSVVWVQANVVHANDQFADNGPGEKPTHTYSPFDPPEKRGAMVGAYCVAKTAGGDHLTCIMPMHEIFAIRDRSETWKRKMEKEAKGEKGFGGPWETDFGEQVKKTVIRRAFKTWPKTDTLERMAAAVDLSNNNEGFEPILSSPALGQYTADQKAYFDQLISTSDKMGMFLFTKSIDETTYANLYHSFEKGQKGRYQAIVKQLAEEGAAMLRDIADSVADAADQGHDFGIVENLQGLTTDAVAYIKDRLTAQQAATVNAALEQAAA